MRAGSGTGRHCDQQRLGQTGQDRAIGEMSEMSVMSGTRPDQKVGLETYMSKQLQLRLGLHVEQPLSLAVPRRPPPAVRVQDHHRGVARERQQVAEEPLVGVAVAHAAGGALRAAPGVGGGGAVAGRRGRRRGG